MNLEQANPNPEPKKAPTLLLVITLLMIIGAIFLIFGGLLAVLTAGLLTSAYMVIFGIVVLILSINLRKLRKWSFYAYGVLLGLGILSVIYEIITKFSWIFVVSLIINALILIYIWSIRNQFN